MAPAVEAGMASRSKRSFVRRQPPIRPALDAPSLHIGRSGRSRPNGVYYKRIGGELQEFILRVFYLRGCLQRHTFCQQRQGLRAPPDRKNILLLHFTRSAAAAQNAGGMDKPIPMPAPARTTRRGRHHVCRAWLFSSKSEQNPIRFHFPKRRLRVADKLVRGGGERAERARGHDQPP